MQQGRLIVFAGLPGCGKSTIAQELAQTICAPVIAIDPIEAAMWRSEIPKSMTGIAAYEIAAAVAAENLKLGLTVIVDAVNPVAVARATWVRLAAHQKSTLIFVECYCSDLGVHRQRIERRFRDIAGMSEITWERVEQRRAEYEPWSMDRIEFDTTAAAPESLVNRLLMMLAES